jgi:hypothetical protein
MNEAPFDDARHRVAGLLAAPLVSPAKNPQSRACVLACVATLVGIDGSDERDDGRLAFGEKAWLIDRRLALLACSRRSLGRGRPSVVMRVALRAGGSGDNLSCRRPPPTHGYP